MPSDTGVCILSDQDHLKYSFVRRRTYDYYVDRSAKRFDGIIQQLSNLESHIQYLVDKIEILDAELEGVRLDKTSVRIAGRRDATERKV